MRVFSLILMVMTALFFAGCGFVADQKDFTIRSTITATYDGKAVEGSAVLFQRLENRSTNLTRGEAIVLELGNGKRAYLLLMDRDFTHVYSRVIHNAFGPPKWNFKKPVPPGTLDKTLATPVGARSVYDYKHWANRAGSRFYGHPLLVAFEDEADPTSVFLVETEEATQLFGQRFVFGSWYIERLSNDTALTNEIEAFLPFVNDSHGFWADRRAAGYTGNSMQALSLRQKGGTASFAQKVQSRHFYNVNKK